MKKSGPLIIVVGSAVVFMACSYFAYRYIWAKAEHHFKKAEYQQVYKFIKFSPKPRNTNKLRIYAQTSLALGKFDSAKNAYSDLYKKTNDVSYKLILGNIANQQQNFDEAIEIYEQVIALNPNYIQSYVNLSTVYRVKGNVDKATEIAERGISQNSGSTVLYELLVSLMQEKKNSPRYREAINQLKSLDPQNILLKQLGEAK